MTPMDVLGKLREKSFLTVACCFFVLGAVVTFGLLYYKNIPFACENKYPLLSGRTTCSRPGNAGSDEWAYEGLRNDIIKKISELEQTKNIQHVSVYFRDLDHGPRFGVEEYADFYPASLLKVPVMIALLHEADKDPKILDDKMSFSKTPNIILNLENSGETIEPNTFYTVRQLLAKTIINSDNLSDDLLATRLQKIPGQTVMNSFLDLGILPVMVGTTDYISIQSYSYLFGVLYGAGYLSKDMSQYALDLLSRSTYVNGLVAGVPKGIRVAHKFGYREIDHKVSQLHDCGIVYHPKTAYILCVMTSGQNIDDEAEGIAEISHVVFDEVGIILRKG